MTDYLVKGQGAKEGYVTIANPASGLLRELEFGRLGLVTGRPYEAVTGDREMVLDILSGVCRLEIAGGETFESLGGRPHAFAGDATFICLPPGTRFCLTALTATVDMAVSWAPAEPGLPVSIVRPGDLPLQPTGAANWSRTIRPGTSVAPTTRRLMMAETLVPPGNWTSYPPHKHDVENPPTESIYEEVYFYLFRPAGGYGIQRIYEPRDVPNRLNEAYVVEDGDAVAIPRGYHPLVTAAGYQMVYVWALLGQNRIYGSWSDDPEYSWIRGAEPMLHEAGR